MGKNKRDAITPESDAQAAARIAPAGERHTWFDADGRHEAAVGDDGLFWPTDAADVALADQLGWPAVDAPAPPVTPPTDSGADPAPADQSQPTGDGADQPPTDSVDDSAAGKES